MEKGRKFQNMPHDSTDFEYLKIINILIGALGIQFAVTAQLRFLSCEM